MRQVIAKLTFWKNGEMLVGLVLFLAGLFVAWHGFGKLRELWIFFGSFLPLALPDDVGERLLRSLPLISKVFINTVGSLAAMLMGCAWMLSGLGEAWQAGQKPSEPLDIHEPERVAELVRTGQGQYWRSSSPLWRLMGMYVPRARLVSPISHEMMNNLLWGCIKIVFVGIGIAVFWCLLNGIPGVVKTYLHREITLVVPPARPLFALLGFVVFVHLLIAVSLLPFKRPEFVRSREALSVRGSNDPNAFFALLEEGCKLLNAVDIPPRAPARLVTDGNMLVKATLVETTPEALRSVARPAAYACLPLAFFPVTLGFSRLIDFQRPVDPMPYKEFLSVWLLSHALEVAFALALIVVGLHFAEQARRLFGVRRFRSALVFAFALSDCVPTPGTREDPSETNVHFGTENVRWKPAHGADDCFATWARSPHASGRFAVDLVWAEAFSESAANGRPRFVIDLRQSNALDEAMEQIVKLPFHVAFQLDGPSHSNFVS